MGLQFFSHCLNESDSSSLAKRVSYITRREQTKKETRKFWWSFSRVGGFFVCFGLVFFLNFHPISLSSSVHSLVNNSGKPQAAKSDPCIFPDAEGI